MSPNEIRICFDMRHANRAILMTRHISPTVDELTTDLNSATAFSKLDLKSGCNQLELHPSCRCITTFSTYVAFYQHERDSFGINSAAEIFQHTIQTLIADISGVQNVSDDIVVYGRNQNEHEAALDQTLRRLHKPAHHQSDKMRVQQAKHRVLRVYIFRSAHGLAPAPKKVKPLQDVA